MIQNEDRSRSFSDLIQNPSDEKKKPDSESDSDNSLYSTTEQASPVSEAPVPAVPSQDTVYKVFIGSYTSAEQAKVAKEIIQESGRFVFCIVESMDSALCLFLNIPT